MMNRRSKSLVTVVALGVLGSTLGSSCAVPRVVLALRDERIKVGMTSAEVIAQAGPPVMWIAKDSVETLYYRHGKLAVYVSFLDDRVVGYDDRAEWPEPAWQGASEARRARSVSGGRIRVGMPETRVREILGRPSGITAKGGIETFHWVSNRRSDSVVEIQDGKVVGYVDLQTQKYSQNIPSHDRKNSTTSGKVRVGMSKQDVQAMLGRPHSVSAKDGLVAHRYDSNAIFGNDLVYEVEYQEERVVGFSQHNKTLAKKERKTKEQAERDQQRAGEEDSGPSRTRRIFGFLLNHAVKQALGKRRAGAATGPGPQSRVDTCNCPNTSCGRLVVPGCAGRCSLGMKAICQCKAACTPTGVEASNRCFCR